MDERAIKDWDKGDKAIKHDNSSLHPLYTDRRGRKTDLPRTSELRNTNDPEAVRQKAGEQATADLDHKKGSVFLRLKSGQTLWTMRVIVFAGCSHGAAMSLQSDNNTCVFFAFMSKSEGCLGSFDPCTCLGVGRCMNGELSSVLTTNFPIVSLSSHTVAALSQLSLEQRALSTEHMHTHVVLRRRLQQRHVLT